MSADSGKLGRWLLVAAAVVIAATVVAAIALMGSPSAQRQSRLDEKRVRDLQRIDRVVGRYLDSHGALPADLATLAAQPGQRLAIADPVDGAPYGYETTGPRTFRLCAGFATDTAQAPGGAPWALEDGWHHGAGRQCFDRRPKQPSRGD